MSDREFMNAVATSLLERATPRLRKLLRERGVQHLSELPPEEMARVRQQAILQTVLTENPLADAESLRLTLQTFDDPQFLRALERVKKDAMPTDAFEPTAGIDAALVFGGLGPARLPLRSLPPCPDG